VEILSLSLNKITTLRDFANCPKLTELYLRKNLIADLGEIKYL
jgi:Leucine-rich repeat (LRR) protein